MNTASTHKWRFFRAGGVDQVLLEKGADLAALKQLDQKLWTALSCPTQGLELDRRTLELIDTDNDGVIRAPEVIAAVQWAHDMLKDPDQIFHPSDRLPLAAINDSTPEGQQLLASARQILTNLGQCGAAEIGVDQFADSAAIFASTVFNGDGIIAPAAAEPPELQLVIQQIMDCLGAETDRSGQPGISQERADLFFNALDAYSQWWALAESEATRILPLQEATPKAAETFRAVRDKINDYFTRCQLATYDGRAALHLSPAEADYDQLATRTLSATAQEVAGFPLARIEAGRPLPLLDGVNPAWSGAVAALARDVVTPLLGNRQSLTQTEWLKISALFDDFDAWQAKKTGVEVEALGLARVREILAGGAREAVAALIGRDRALEGEANGITAVERLVRYNRDLHTLLNNFVSFSDFYCRRNKAIFQAGTLYIDGRSCDLCIRVHDPAKHASLSTLSRTCLLYCDCLRRGSNEKMTIVAAITAGDADQLMVGRNGLFYDRQGRDWDATVTKLVDHPISIRQAFWTPYRRIGRMVHEQIEKFAASKEKAIQDSAASGIKDTEKSLTAEKTPTPPTPFDVGKFAGIFAAIGLAVGAIGTAIASVVTGLLALAWWKIPLVVIGALLAISGPSMILAYLKLRQRNLGPLLDANGWAINSRARINIPFGGSLTHLATLPPGATRRLEDPFAEKKSPWKLYLVLLALLAATAVLWNQGYIDQWLGRTTTEAPASSPSAPK